MARFLKRGATYEAPAKLNEADVNIDSLNDVIENGGDSGGAPAYQIYRGLLGHDEEDNPVFTALENTFGQEPEQIKFDVGQYVLKFYFPTAGFDINKVYVAGVNQQGAVISPLFANNGFVQCSYSFADLNGELGAFLFTISFYANDLTPIEMSARMQSYCMPDLIIYP